MWVIAGSFLLAMTCLFGGEPIVESPKEITSEWEKNFLGIKYQVTTLDNAVHEIVDGLIDSYFKKDFFDRVSAELKKNPTGEGEYLEYWNNGTLKARLPYKDGKAHGHLHGWYDNGCDAFKGFFENGMKQGIHITFFHKEPDEHQRKSRLLIFNKKGMLNGDIRVYHPTGRLWFAIEYENGKANGPLESWGLDKKYLVCAQYKNGILQKEPPIPPEKRGRLKPAPYGKYVDEATNEFLNFAYKKFGMTCWGSGGSMPFDVENIGVQLSIRKKGTIEEARELIVNLKEKLTQIINQHEKLRPYLREFPFTPSRAQVYLSFCDKKGQKNKDGSVAYVLAGNEKDICYCEARPKKPLTDLLVEPYEEAVKIVRSKQQAKASLVKTKKGGSHVGNSR